MTLSHREIVGLGLGTVIGTFDAPTFMIPVTSFSLQEVTTQILDNGRRGPDAMDFRAVQGVKQFNISIEGLVHPQGATGFGLGLLLRNILNKVSVRTAFTTTALANNDFDMGNVKTYLSIEHRTRVTDKTRQVSGCRVSSLVLRWNAGEGALSFTAELVGRKLALATDASLTDLTAQVQALQDPFQGWRANTAFNTALAHNVPNFARMISSEWTLTRTLTPFFSGKSEQEYTDIYAGPLSAVVAMVLDYPDDVELALYRAGTQVAMVNKFQNIAPITAAAVPDTTMRRFYVGANVVSLIEAPAVLDSGGENITLGISGRCLYNEEASKITLDPLIETVTVDDDKAFSPAANAGPIQFRLTDTRTTAY